MLWSTQNLEEKKQITEPEWGKSGPLFKLVEKMEFFWLVYFEISKKISLYQKVTNNKIKNSLYISTK